MSNEVMTTNGQLTTPSADNATLMDMRLDSKRYPRLASYPREKAIFEMTKIVTQAHLYKGQNADPANIQFIATALVDELQADMDRCGTKYISFAEISRVVKRAILQDEMYGISVASLYKIIIEYVKGEGHRLDKEISDRKLRSQQEEIKNSIIAPMLSVYAVEFAKKK